MQPHDLLASFVQLTQLGIFSVDFFYVLVHGIAIKNSSFAVPDPEPQPRGATHCILKQDIWDVAGLIKAHLR